MVFFFLFVLLYVIHANIINGISIFLFKYKARIPTHKKDLLVALLSLLFVLLLFSIITIPTFVFLLLFYFRNDMLIVTANGLNVIHYH